VHVVATEIEHPAAYYVRLIYLPLIFLTIGGMGLHNLFDFLRKSTAPRTQAVSVGAEATVEERMMLGFRIAHLLVVVSFPLLVYTGFALKYPESWWAQPINYFEADFDLRGWLHRAAAVMLIGAFIFHFIHLVRSRRARACILQMRPRVVDIRELKDRFLYYLGKRKHPPHGISVGYIEKSEYLAFIWGTLIMGVTGFLLWFENVTLQWLPSWVPEAATAIHFYEAILASLAILVWHFYWVIFDPDVYPMDASWWTGKAPAGRELERRPAAEAEAASSTGKEPPWQDLSS
jgi:cytochrome b subunit of formate dehydrogenase